MSGAQSTTLKPEQGGRGNVRAKGWEVEDDFVIHGKVVNGTGKLNENRVGTVPESTT